MNDETEILDFTEDDTDSVFIMKSKKILHIKKNTNYKQLKMKGRYVK